MISVEFVKMLRCLDDRSPLRLATAAELTELNAAIAGGGLRTRGGQRVTKSLEAALLRSDRRLAYPVVESIPILLLDEALALDTHTWQETPA